MADHQSGTVKWSNDSRGFGFITPESSDDLFVHFRAIQGEGFKRLQEDQKATFVAVKGPNGMQADQVQVVASSTSWSEKPASAGFFMPRPRRSATARRKLSPTAFCLFSFD